MKERSGAREQVPFTWEAQVGWEESSFLISPFYRGGS